MIRGTKLLLLIMINANITKDINHILIELNGTGFGVAKESKLVAHSWS